MPMDLAQNGDTFLNIILPSSSSAGGNAGHSVVFADRTNISSLLPSTRSIEHGQRSDLPSIRGGICKSKDYASDTSSLTELSTSALDAGSDADGTDSAESTAVSRSSCDISLAASESLGHYSEVEVFSSSASSWRPSAAGSAYESSQDSSSSSWETDPSILSCYGSTSLYIPTNSFSSESSSSRHSWPIKTTKLAKSGRSLPSKWTRLAQSKPGKSASYKPGPSSRESCHSSTDAADSDYPISDASTPSSKCSSPPHPHLDNSYYGTSRDALEARQWTVTNSRHKALSDSGTSSVRQSKRALKRNKQSTLIPLGPRHLEYDYHAAHEDLKVATIRAAYALGYNPTQRRRPISQSAPWSIDVLEEQVMYRPTLSEILAAKFPDVERARRRLNQADRRLQIAISHGRTWANTPIPRYLVRLAEESNLADGPAPTAFIAAGSSSTAPTNRGGKAMEDTDCASPARSVDADSSSPLMSRWSRKTGKASRRWGTVLSDN